VTFAVHAAELVRGAGRLALRQVVVARRERFAGARRGDAQLAGLTRAARPAASIVTTLAAVALRLARIRNTTGRGVAELAGAALAARSAAPVVAAELAVALRHAPVHQIYVQREGTERGRVEAIDDQVIAGWSRPVMWEPKFPGGAASSLQWTVALDSRHESLRSESTVSKSDDRASIPTVVPVGTVNE
jgi:hypothetical protein